MLNQLAKELMIIRAFCVLIALSMGVLSPVFANAAQPGNELTTSKYVLPDGSLQIICFGNGDGSSKNAIHCDDCLLSHTPIASLPAFEGCTLPLVKTFGSLLAGQTAYNLPQLFTRKQSRAPPLV